MSQSDRKQREFARREIEIIEAALILFKKGDIRAVTIDHIAEKADVGKGTVYKHFKSKDEIYARIVLEINQQIIVSIKGIDATLPPRERLNQIIDLIWSFNMKDANFLYRLTQQIMSGEFASKLSAPMKEALGRIESTVDQLYIDIIRQGIDAGEIIEQDPESLYFCISAAVDGAILSIWQMRGNGVAEVKNESEYLEQLKAFIYRAIHNIKKNSI